MSGQGEESDGNSRRQGIQSVETGMRVLQGLVSLGEPAALGAVAQAVGMSNSQVHRYLRSLIAAGMAQQDGDTGRYDIGPAALKLGLSALSRVEAFTVADRDIIRYSERWGRTVQVAALGPFGPTIVRWNMGRPPVMTSFGLGSVLSLLYSATGQVFLAFVPAVESEPLVRIELKRSSSMTAKDVERIRCEVHARGFARVEGSVLPGLRAMACPIRDLQGRAILVATLVDSTEIERDNDEGAQADLLRTCAGISEQLGWRSSHSVERI